MASRRPGPGELVAGAGGLLLLLALFLPWFGLDGQARVPSSGEVITVGKDNLSAWEAFAGIDVLLALVAVLAIALLAVALVARPPAELAAAVSGAAAVGALLIVFRLIDVPDVPFGDVGEDTAYEIGRRFGAFLGLLCTAAIGWGAGRVAAEAAARAPEAAPAATAAKPAPAAPKPAPAAEKPARRAPRPAPAAPKPAPAAAKPAPAAREAEPAGREPAAAPPPVPAGPKPARPHREPEPAAPGPEPAVPEPVPAAREPEPPVPEPEPAAPAPALAAWTRADVEARCQAAWRRYDRRLGTRYARYFEQHPDLAGDQRTSARDLVAALPPGWEAPADAMPDRSWQRHHLSAKSSEMLGVGLLGVAATQDRSLAWLWDALGPLPPAADDEPALQFAHVVDPTLLGERPRPTAFDVLVDDPAVLIGVETKWREHGVGACRCRGDGVGLHAGERCSRSAERRQAYWDAATDVLGLPAREPTAPCPISPVYETVRHAAALRALAKDRLAVLALVYDADNPYYAGTGDWPGWAQLLADAIDADADDFRFAAISWQELVPRLPLDDDTRTWAADKHGLPQ